MPSLETIRTVRVKGEADGVDATTAALNRLTASIRAANDNLARSDAAARQADAGWSLTSEGAAKAANHLRQAAEAAYAFSPAFRGVVNELALPALQGAGTALVAVAGGLVTATNAVGTGVTRLGTAVETSYPAFSGLGVALKAAGGWMEAFNPTLTGVAGTILGKLMPALRVLGPALLVLDGIKLVAQAWELGNQRLQEFVDIANKAAETGISNEFFQRITKGAEAARTPVDALTASFKKLNEATGPQLGGTAAQNRLTELTKAGNFGGNSGVAALGNADTTEAKFRAVAKLVDDAMQKGERLAALDVAKSFLGEEVAANLAKDSDYLDRVLASADAIAAKDLIPDRAIENAVMLQSRLDAAEKILSERWHPIQELLVQLGIKMKEVWVDIVEAIANAVDAVFRLGQRIADALGPAMDYLRTAANLAGKVAAFAGNGLGPIGAAIGLGGQAASSLTVPAETEDPMAASRRALGASLANRARLQDAIQQATATETRVRGDTSRNPKAVEDTTAAYDRATESLLKYIATTNAAADSVGKSVAEQEKAKATAQLLAAAEKDGTKVTAEMRAEIDKLAERAGAAAQALEKAKVAADIKFNRDTALLSQDDVQIASALKGIYPDVATALGSVEAQAMRTNTAFRSISSSIENELTSGLTDIVSGSKSAGQAFSDMSKTIIRSIEQMIIKLTIIDPLLKGLQSAIGGFGFGGGGAAEATPTGMGGIGHMHSGGIVGTEPTFTRSISASVFSGAPRFHGGGIAGDEVPIIARKGEGVFTAGQMAAMGAANSNTRAPNVIINNHTEAKPEVSVSSNGDVTVTLKKMVDDATADSLSTGKGRRVLGSQYGVKSFTGQ